jgi:TetR/AcrR family transcriptional regulator, transcriptional repressor of aconitase
MPRLSDQERQRRRDLVVEGARLSFAKWGYHGCTVERLEQELGQSRGAIFNWFPDKWRLFLAVSEADQRRIADALSDHRLDLIGWIARLEIPYAQAYAEALGLIAHDPEKKREWEQRSPALFDSVYAAIEERQRRGELRSDVSSRALIQFILLFVDGLTLRRSVGYAVSVKDAQILRALVLDAIGPRD